MAARKIKYDDRGIPDRIETGIGNKTIKFPTEHYYGDPDEYQFRSSTMLKYWAIFKALCERHGLTNIKIGSELVTTYAGSRRRMRNISQNDSFVVVAGDDTGIKFIWQRYMPHNTIGAINRVFCNGQEIPSTSFLDAPSIDAQDRLYEPVELRQIMRRLVAGKMPIEGQVDYS